MAADPPAKGFINNVDGEPCWYVQEAREKTRHGQVRGYCMQSGTYPMVGVAIDYIGDGTIRQVAHTSTIGCDL